MRITILTQDTMGGVLPYAALAAGLAQAGHQVNAVAPSRLSHLFDAVGIPVHPLSGTSAADIGNATAVAEQGTIAAIRFMARQPKLDWTAELRPACAGTDLILGSVGGMVIGLGVAAELGVPFQVAHLQPIGLRSRNFPGLLLPGTPEWCRGALFPASQMLSTRRSGCHFGRRWWRADGPCDACLHCMGSAHRWWIWLGCRPTGP